MSDINKNVNVSDFHNYFFHKVQDAFPSYVIMRHNVNIKEFFNRIKSDFKHVTINIVLEEFDGYHNRVYYNLMFKDNTNNYSILLQVFSNDGDKNLTSNNICIYYNIRLDEAIRKKNLIVKIAEEMHIIEAESEDPCFDIMLKENGTFCNRTNYINNFKKQDLDLAYGEGMQEYTDKLIEEFKNKSKGIVLFYGEPGTGKTHYIRNLISEINKKTDNKILYIQNTMIEHFSDPEFLNEITDLAKEKSLVIIIEDGEKIIKSRDINQLNESISNILNMSDGLLNDILNTQFIITFNCSFESIDPAILRAGRLISSRKFQRLDKENAKKFAKSIDVILNDKEDYTLAEIYEMKNNDISEILIDETTKKFLNR